MKNYKRRNVLIVSHDAGGAEIVSAYVNKFKDEYNFKCLVLGPAADIFKRKKIKNLLNKGEAIKLLDEDEFDLVLVGTSWGSPIELEMIKEAKKRGVKSVAYLEHWVNYRERFGYPQKNWQANLPGEIWVGDKYALRLARKLFKTVPVKLAANLYFQEIKDRYKKISQKTKGEKNLILFMSEPIAGAVVNSFGRKMVLKFSEFEILEALLKYLSERKMKDRLVICYHPSEKRDKYDFLLARYKNIKAGRQSDEILDDMARASLVIGMMGMILVVAYLCGKKVISFIPDKKVKYPLPFPEIIKIRNTKELEAI